VFYVIDQNVNIFRGFVHHRPYFRQFSKNPFKNPIDFRARELVVLYSLPRFGLQSDVVTSAFNDFVRFNLHDLLCNVRTRTKVYVSYYFRLHFPVKIRKLVILPKTKSV